MSQSGTVHRCPGLTLSVAMALSRGRKGGESVVFIHRNALEMEVQPQPGKLFKRKAAASSNLTYRTVQTRAHTAGEARG